MQSMLGLGKAPAGASVSLSPGSIEQSLVNGTGFNATVTATPIGITSPTYLWSWLSGGTGFTLSGTTTATVTVTASGRTNTEISGELQCVVSGTGGPKSSSASIDVFWGTGV